MSILIKGIEMPQSCWDCYFQDCGNCRLNADKVVDKCIIEDRRDEDCPLVPVPPHGDLIDRDALPWEKQSLMAADEDWALPCVLIEDAPTIIPAEEGEA